MKHLVPFATLAMLTYGGVAWAGSEPCTDVSRHSVNCKKSSQKAPQKKTRGMSRTEEDNLNRGMSRNVLQSIEDQVRRRRIGD